jgi:hypothetical protein
MDHRPSTRLSADWFCCLSVYQYCLSIFAAIFIVGVKWREELDGSFGIFEMRASFAGMPNVPDSEGTVCAGLSFH